MKGLIGGLISCTVLLASPALAIQVTRAEINKGKVLVGIKNAEPNAPVTWQGQLVGTTNNGGRLNFETTVLPSDCVGEIGDGTSTVEAVIKDCGPVSEFEQRFGSDDTSSATTTEACLPLGDGYMGQVFLVAFDFCPRGTAHAHGQLLLISQHNTLFALLGTQFGGDGNVTFGLPDMRGLEPAGVNYCVCLGGFFPSRD